MTTRTSRRRARSLPGVAGCAALVLAGGLVAVPGALASPSTTATSGAPQTFRSDEGVDVPVHGVVSYRARTGPGEVRVVTAAVHGVRRVEGATVLYWSAGTRDPRGLSSQELGKRSTQPVRSWTPYSWTGYALLTDPVTLRGVDGSTLDLRTNLSSPADAYPVESPGTMWVMFQVFPELPQQTRVVDVTLGSGAVVRDVPVLDGPLTPTRPADSPLALGDGWPDLDPALLSSDPEPDLSRFPLAAERVAVDGSQTVLEEADEVRVDLSADVLFAVGSADVGADAVARLEELAATIDDEALAGPISIVGHTDSDGSDADNLDLSQRRAEAVADVLLPLVQVEGLRPSVEGRGEAEPVRPDSTDEGKQANRRVTVTYVPDRGEQTP